MRPKLLRGHEKPITIVKFNFDGDLLFTGASEKRINLWYSLSGERVGSYETGSAVRTLDVTNDSKYLVSGCTGGDLEFFTVDGGQRLGGFKVDAIIHTVQLSYGDKKLLVLLSWFAKDKRGITEFLVFDFEEVMANIKKGKDPAVADAKSIETTTKYRLARWGPLNEYIIAGTEDGRIQLIGLDGKIIREKTLHEEGLNSFTLTNDFSLLMTSSSEGSLLVDPETLEVKKAFKTEVPMNSGSLSPLIFDKKKPKYHAIIAGGVLARDAAKHKMGGFEIRLINIITEEEIGNIAGHFGPVNTVSFYPDGRGFVSGGEEGIIRLFRFDEKYFTEFD